VRSASARLREIILALMEIQDISQIELADRVGHSRRHVAQVLRGTCELSLPLAEKMLAALDMNVVVGVSPGAVSERDGRWSR
jgi:transcriptional regulator with XRE-family HTH domain